MQIKCIILWFFQIPDNIFSYFVGLLKKSFLKNELLDDVCLAYERRQAYRYSCESQKNWFRAAFYFTDVIPVKKEMIPANVPASSPKYFSVLSGKALKIIHVRNNSNIFTPGLYVLNVILTLASLFVAHSAFEMSHCSDICRYGISFSVASIIVYFIYFCSFMYFSVVSKALQFPYLIFDHAKRAIIIRGDGYDESVPYNRISFSLLPIMGSPAYCAIEINISNAEHGVIPQRMLLEFCESHRQAQSILKTYFSILDGNDGIFGKKLKRYPVVIGELYTSFFDGVMYIVSSAIDKISCVFPYYVAFRLVYGNPMGVLKQYIHEQEYLRPKEIAQC